MEVSVVWFHTFTSLQLKNLRERKKSFYPFKVMMVMTMAKEEGERIYLFCWVWSGIRVRMDVQTENFPEEKTCRAHAHSIEQAPRCGIAADLLQSRMLPQFCSCVTLAFFFFIGYGIFLGVGQLVAVVGVRRRNYQHRRSNASDQNWFQFHKELSEERIPW